MWWEVPRGPSSEVYGDDVREFVVLLQQSHSNFNVLYFVTMHQHPKGRVENKPHRNNLPQRDYEDEQDLCLVRPSDSA